MPMNLSTRLDFLGITDLVEEHRDNPSADTVPHELSSDEQPRRENAAGSYARDECTFETFVDGAGI
jgi:hypothetical protein